MKAVIIEDEIPSARLLHSMVLSLRPDWDVEIIPGNVDDAIEWFDAHEHPQMIFLDIHLTDGDAFDFLSVVKPQSAIIFTTAYDQYALRAFSVNSIDYILKPVAEQRLADAIEKYEVLYDSIKTQSAKYMEIVLEALKHPEKKYRSRFLIYGGDKFWTLRVADIAYFYLEDKATFAVTSGNQQYMLDLSLNKLEEQLEPTLFFRVNRQLIVNIDAVDHASPYYKGRLKVSVNPPFKSDVIVSEEKAAAFKAWLNF